MKFLGKCIDKRNIPDDDVLQFSNSRRIKLDYEFLNSIKHRTREAEEYLKITDHVSDPEYEKITGISMHDRWLIEFEEIHNDFFDELIKIITKSLCNDNYAFEVINKYINKNFNSNLDYEGNIAFLKTLEKKLYQFNYIPSMYVLRKLIKENARFRDMTKFIFEKNKEKILSGNLLSTFDSYLVIILMEAYCSIINITIPSKLNIQFISSFYPDLTDEEKFQIASILLDSFPLSNYELEMFNKNMEFGDDLEKIRIREQVISRLYLLVIPIVTAYSFQNKNLRIDFEKLTYKLLKEALEEYDSRKGFDFNNFIIFAIRNDLEYEFEHKRSSARVARSKLQILRRKENFFKDRLGTRVHDGGFYNEPKYSSAGAEYESAAKLRATGRYIPNH